LPDFLNITCKSLIFASIGSKTISGNRRRASTLTTLYALCKHHLNSVSQGGLIVKVTKLIWA